MIEILANSATVFEELRRDKTKRIDRVEEKAQQGHEKLRDELADAKSGPAGSEHRSVPCGEFSSSLQEN